MVAISGSNFDWNDAIKVFTSLSPFTPITVSPTPLKADGNGSISGYSFTMPSPGNNTVVYVWAADSTTPSLINTSNSFLLNVTGTTNTRQITSLSTYTGVAGQTQVTVQGSGFPANATVTILFGSYAASQTLSASSTGYINGAVTVPASIPVGSYYVTGSDSGGSSPNYLYQFTVSSSTNTRQITSLSTYTGVAGQTQVTVQGSGFPAYATVTILFGSYGASQTLSASSTGYINGAVTVPASIPVGSYYVTGSDSGGSSPNYLYQFTVSGSTNTRQIISLSTLSGVAGQTSVTVQGTGFQNNVPVTVTFGGVAASPALYATNGTIYGYVTVPASLPAGSYYVSASDSGGNAPNYTYQFTVTSGTTGRVITSLSTLSGVAGQTSVTVQGTGFQNNVPVTVTFGGVAASPVLYATNGAISGAVTVPASLTVGSYYVSASDSGGNAPNYGYQFTVTSGTTGRVITSISPNPAAPGSVVVVNGSGFSNGATVYLTYGTTASTSYMTASSTGALINAQTTVPATLTPGQYNVVATELYNSTLVSAPYTFTVGSGPSLSAASTTSAAVGQTIQLSGVGFTPSGYVQVYFGSTPVVTQIQASTSGTLTNVNVVVPVVGLGSQPITAIDMSTSKTSNALTFTISSSATGTLTVSPNSGQPTNSGVQNTTVTLVSSNSQLPANTAVSITFTDAAGNVVGPLTASVTTTDGSGNYSGTVTFPAQAAGGIGTFKITAGSQLVTGTFKVLPLVVVSPTTAAPGGSITVTGNGYAVGSTVSLLLASTSLPTSPSTLTANSQGSFTATATIPATAALSAYTYVYAQDSTGNQQTSAVFAVSNATATPTPTATPTVTTTPTATPINGTGSYNAYLAEGYTGLATTNGKATFTETLNILNPTSSATNATITYFIQGGSPMTLVKQVPALSVLRESVNADVGADKIVAAQVSSNSRLAVTRTLNRVSASGTRLDGATTESSNSPATFWAFPEGYTGISFQEYLTILNPGTSVASVQIVLAPQAATSAGAHVLTLTVPPQSRYTANIRGLNQGNKVNSVGMLVTSSAPIVAERVEYFGDGSGSGKFGETVARGFTSSATELRIPYGSSGGAAPDIHGHLQAVGDQEYITLLNPATSGNPVHVTVGFNNALGQGLGTPQGLNLAPGTRTTVVANLAIGTTAAGPFVVSISSNGAIVAEAAQYFAGSPNVGLHPGVVLPGFTGATTDAFISDLSTQQADGTQIQRNAYIYNPTGTIENVAITYFGTNGATAQASYTVPAGGASTVNVNTDVQNSLPAGAIGAEVKLAAGSSGSFIVAGIGRTVDNLSYTEDFGIPLP